MSTTTLPSHAVVDIESAAWTGDWWLLTSTSEFDDCVVTPVG